ncbi:hypothetical protein T439DRAFT_325665 [Meredithblackwellia eburnea MCA 4105]
MDSNQSPPSPPYYTPPAGSSSPFSTLPSPLLALIFSHLSFITSPQEMISLSLVCRNFLGPAQSELWRELFFFPRDHMLPAILESSALGKHETTELVFQGSAWEDERFDVEDAGEAKEIARLVKMVKGVEKMRISEHKALDPGILLGGQLKDLKNLTLNHLNFNSSQHLPPAPYQLRSFQLTSSTPFPAALLRSVLTPTASSDTLRTLAININPLSSAFEVILAFFPKLASGLTRLEIPFGYDLLLPLLKDCNSLTELAITAPNGPEEAIMSILKALSEEDSETRLVKLEIVLRMDDHSASYVLRSAASAAVGELDAALDIELEAVENLEEVVVTVLHSEERGKVDDLGTWEELVETAEDKVVEVRVVYEDDGF